MSAKHPDAAAVRCMLKGMKRTKTVTLGQFYRYFVNSSGKDVSVSNFRRGGYIIDILTDYYIFANTLNPHSRETTQVTWTVAKKDTVFFS